MLFVIWSQAESYVREYDVALSHNSEELHKIEHNSINQTFTIVNKRWWILKGQSRLDNPEAQTTLFVNHAYDLSYCNSLTN